MLLLSVSLTERGPPAPGFCAISANQLHLLDVQRSQGYRIQGRGLGFMFEGGSKLEVGFVGPRSDGWKVSRSR